MSKNLIIDYLSRIESQIDELKGLAGKFDTDHVLNIGTIRQQKARTAAEISRDVVNISGSKYIRDENRIIISAPEIIIGNVDKNGNLIASDGSTRVVLRSNNVGLEGVGKDDGSIGSVTMRASRISQIAVDPGIDGMENVVAPTSEILSVAKGIELRSDWGNHCVERDLNVPVQKGLHLYSPSDIEIASSSSCRNRKTELASHQKVIAEGLKEISEQLADTDLSIALIMGKIRTLADSEVYDVNRFTLSFSYTEIDAANRKLESYLIALLREFDKFFHLHSRLFELEREDVVIKSELEELAEQTLPPCSQLKISVPVMRLKSEDGDGNFRTDGMIQLRTHTLLAFGKGCSDEDVRHGTKMKVRFNRVNIDTSHCAFDASTNKYQYTVGGQIRLNSKHVSIESVNAERTKGTKKKEKDLCHGGSICLNAQNTDISSLTKDGKNVGEVNVNSKRIKMVSHDVDANGKMMEIPGSLIAIYSNTIKLGKVNPEKDEKKSIYSKTVYIAGEKMHIRTDYFYTALYEKIADTECIGHIKLTPDKGIKLSSKKPIVMYVDGNQKVKIESGTMTVWPDFKAMTSISNVPSIVVDNLEVKKAFKSPSTEEGIAIKSPAPNAPSEPQEENEESPQVLITKEPLPSRVEAQKALAECDKKEEEYNEKKREAQMKTEEYERAKTEREDVEKEQKASRNELKKRIARKDELNKEIDALKAQVKKGNATAIQGEPQKAEVQQAHAAATQKSVELDGLIKDGIPGQEAKVKEIKARLDQKKQEKKTARKALKDANKQVEDALKAWNEANRKAVEAVRKAEKDEEAARESS